MGMRSCTPISTGIISASVALPTKGIGMGMSVEKSPYWETRASSAIWGARSSSSLAPKPSESPASSVSMTLRKAPMPPAWASDAKARLKASRQVRNMMGTPGGMYLSFIAGRARRVNLSAPFPQGESH